MCRMKNFPRKYLLLCLLGLMVFHPSGSQAQNDGFLAAVDYEPRDAQYFDPIDDAYQLTTEEITLLEQNGFVVSERLAYRDFLQAYAWIYSKDLPVVITTDALLGAVHETYADLLMRAEQYVLAPMLDDLLAHTHSEARALETSDSRLSSTYHDLDTYLSVALALLRGEVVNDDLYAAAYIQDVMMAGGVADVNLFGGKPRQVDFTRFQPTGHYIKSEELSRYYRAMMWLALIDFRLLDYDEYGTPVLNVEPIAAAALLRDLLDTAGTRSQWEELDSLLSTLFGKSDNSTLSDLDRFLTDANITTPQAAFDQDPQRLTALLTTKDYGNQRITGQILTTAPDNPDTLPRPVSFMLLGQRYTLDSFIMSELVFDRLLVNGKRVERPFPSSLDVMAALGSDRAMTHLQDEFTRYGYQDRLEELRTAVEGYDGDYWTQTIYNQWLNMLRMLNGSTTAANYPQAMRTAAWADRNLQTQVASWAQLRHDTQLYVKQSYTGNILCEYPAGYVEPYPEFYAALAEYARAGHAFYSSLKGTQLQADGIVFTDTALSYYMHLEAVALQLQEMAEKELRSEPFTAAEELFLKDIIVQQSQSTMCGFRSEDWDGWYAALFPFYVEHNLADLNDYNPFVIADVHTNTAELIPPQGVLHVGTGTVATQLLIVDTDEGATIYVGPAFTYYEFIEPGFPPSRLNDIEWFERLRSDRPSPPTWTASFRVPAQSFPPYLVPGAE